MKQFGNSNVVCDQTVGMLCDDIKVAGGLLRVLRQTRRALHTENGSKEAPRQHCLRLVEQVRTTCSRCHRQGSVESVNNRAKVQRRYDTSNFISCER